MTLHPHIKDRKDLVTTQNVYGMTAGAMMEPEPLQDEGAGTPHPITGRKYSSTQVDLPFDIATEVRQLGIELIPDDDVHPTGGREERPHITVKYGIHDHFPDDVEEALRGVGPVKAIIGDIMIFNADDYDVVNLDVVSPGLKRLNKIVASSTEVTDTHPTYKPHICLAYVKKGRGVKYDGVETILTGQVIEFDKVVFCSRDGEEYVIPLVEIAFEDKGGAGSGHFGHQGRPGLVGGSSGGSAHQRRKRRRAMLRASVGLKPLCVGVACSLTTIVDNIGWQRVTTAYLKAIDSLDAIQKYLDQNDVYDLALQNVYDTLTKPQVAESALSFLSFLKSASKSAKNLIESLRSAVAVKDGPQAIVSAAKLLALCYEAQADLQNELARTSIDDAVLSLEDLVAELGIDPTSVKDIWEQERGQKKGGVGSGNFGHAGRPGLVGGSAAESAASLSLKKKAIQSEADKLFDSLGIDKQELLFEDGETDNRTFSDGTIGTQMAYYGHDDKRFHVWTRNLPVETTGEMLAHEAAHLKQDVAGLLEPEGASLNEDQIELRKWVEDNIKQLAYLDGLTSYSSDVWEKALKGETSGMAAIAETLGEMARYKYLGNPIPSGGEIWEELYDKVEIVYAKAKGRKPILLKEISKDDIWSQRDEVVIYLNDDFEVVDASKATIARVLGGDREGWYKIVDKQQSKGGEGSGHFGHSGRPGLVGGSAAGTTFTAPQLSTLKSLPPAEVEAIAQNQRNKLVDKTFTERQKYALQTYSGTGYININKQLRAGNVDAKVSEQVKYIDDAIAATETDRDLTVYRGIDLAIGTASQRSVSDFQVGKTISDPGFVSTTLDPELAQNFEGKGETVVMAINLPKGSKAFAMYDQFGVKHEEEMLLPRNLSMKIRGTARYPNGGLEGETLVLIFADVEN